MERIFIALEHANGNKSLINLSNVHSFNTSTTTNGLVRYVISYNHGFNEIYPVTEFNTEAFMKVYEQCAIN